jgi:hypothetical protein
MAVMDFGTSADVAIDSLICRVLVRSWNRNQEVHGTMQADRNLASGRDELSNGRPALGCGMRGRRSRRSQWLAILACALAIVSWSAQAADALIVTTTTEDTTQAPQISTDPWYGVPWDNVSYGGSRNFVYLGNGWCLSASHVGPAPWEPDQSLGFAGHSYNMIPGQNYLVKNPSGSGLSTYTDLRLVRIDGSPSLPSITIASTPLTSSNLGQAVGDVTIVGLGNSRESVTHVWNGNNGSYTGYYGLGQNEGSVEYVKRWGRNQIANENVPFGENDPDLHGKLTLFVGKDVNANVDIMSMITQFDQFGIPYEAQAIGGDSGSSVFHKNTSGQWELIGIINAKCLVNESCNEPSNFAPYGDLTTFADLTYYRNEINNIINDPVKNALLPGDYNGDGSVDDKDYVVWRKGLGTTFAQEGYYVWRAHYGETSGGGGSGSTASGSLSGGSGVPEPSSLLLALGAAGVFLFYLRARLHQFV